MRSVQVGAAVLFGILVTTLARGQCNREWLPGPPVVGVAGQVFVILELPNGDLIVGGQFSIAGGTYASNIARWDGQQWFPLGSGTDAGVRALCLLPNGDLIAGGYFQSAGGIPASGLARWDGSTWHAFGGVIGGDPTGVFALHLMQSGDLIVAGSFTTIAGIPANNIARWDGNQFSALGSGATGWSGTRGWIIALAELPSGDLIVGGQLQTAGGVVCNNIARWNGSIWSALAGGTTGGSGGSQYPVRALAILPNGDLLAAGEFNYIGGVVAYYVARWDGTAWHPFDGGTPMPIRSLAVLRSGEVLAGARPWATVMRWQGGSWATIGLGPSGGQIYAIVETFSGDVAVGGSMNLLAEHAYSTGISRWTQGQWQPWAPGSSDTVRSIAVLPNGDVVAAGKFVFAGEMVTRQLARFDGHEWSAFGNGQEGRIEAMTVLPSGELVIAADFGSRRIARWNGANWDFLGGPVSGYVYVMTVLADGTLVIGGQFSAIGEVNARAIAYWDGAAWRPFAMPLGPSARVTQIVQLPSGALAIAGSSLTLNPGISHLALWNGVEWLPLGTLSAGDINRLVVLPNGHLVAAGSFPSLSGVPTSNIARWDGVGWAPLGSGLNSYVFGLSVRPTGELLAQGYFTQSGEVSIPYSALWDGQRWYSLGFSSNQVSFFGVDGLPNGDVLVYGSFSTVGPHISAQIARWGCPDPPTCYANCDGSSVAPILNIADFACFVQRFSAGCP